MEMRLMLKLTASFEKNSEANIFNKEQNMITVYCYEKCSTCKKALKWLEDVYKRQESTCKNRWGNGSRS